MVVDDHFHRVLGDGNKPNNFTNAIETLARRFMLRMNFDDDGNLVHSPPLGVDWLNY